jgi:hypothetical protein
MEVPFHIFKAQINPEEKSELFAYILSTQYDSAFFLSQKMGFGKPECVTPEKVETYCVTPKEIDQERVPLMKSRSDLSDKVIISDLVMQVIMKQEVTLDTQIVELPLKDYVGGVRYSSGEDGHRIMMSHEPVNDINAFATSIMYITPDVAQSLQSPTSRRYYGIPQMQSGRGKSCVFSRVGNTGYSDSK